MSVQEMFESLRGRAIEGVQGWMVCREQFGLGRDAYYACRSTTPQAFEQIRRWLGENSPHARDVLLNPEPEDLDLVLRLHHDALREAIGLDAFWPILAHGIVTLLAAGGLPNLAEGDRSVVLDYDQEMALLSPSYAALRIAAFNDGVRLVIAESSKSWFAPELRIGTVGKAFVQTDSRGGVHTSGLNLAHDTIHIVAYGDAYWGSDGAGTAVLEERLTAAEEASTCFELVFMSEVLEHRRELAMVEILSRGESQAVRGTSRYVQRHLAQTPDAAGEVQQFFTRTALAHLRGRQAPVWELPGVDPFDWISPGALRGHATYWPAFARAAGDNAWRARLAHPSVVDRGQIDRARVAVDGALSLERPAWLGDAVLSKPVRRRRLREREAQRRLAVVADVLHRALVGDDQVDIAEMRAQAEGFDDLHRFTHSVRDTLPLAPTDHHQLAELLTDEGAVAWHAFHGPDGPS